MTAIAEDIDVVAAVDFFVETGGAFCAVAALAPIIKIARVTMAVKVFIDGSTNKPVLSRAAGSVKSLWRSIRMFRLPERNKYGAADRRSCPVAVARRAAGPAFNPPVPVSRRNSEHGNPNRGEIDGLH
jgi:hypothetical protein